MSPTITAAMVLKYRIFCAKTITLPIGLCSTLPCVIRANVRREREKQRERDRESEGEREREREREREKQGET